MFEIPREFAELNKLTELNLEHCPLKPNLAAAYEAGFLTLFQYLRRKNDRRNFKKELMRQLRAKSYQNSPVSDSPSIERRIVSPPASHWLGGERQTTLSRTREHVSCGDELCGTYGLKGWG